MDVSKSTDLKLVNVVNALQKLTLDQTKNLALQLGVELNVLTDITSEEKGESRRARYIQAWLDIDTEASWKKIIVALNQIGMKVFAAYITSNYLRKQPPNQPTPTTQPPLNKATLQPITPDAPQPLNLEKIAQAKATIEHLEDSFSDVMSDTCEQLCEKESKDPKFFNRFRNKLLLLPVPKKRIHIKFFHESEDEIIGAKNVRKIFAILSRYSDYRNYEILLYLVNKFCEAIKSSMMKYCSEIESFEITTTVDIYLLATSGDKKHSDAFSQMVVKMDKQPSMCTLHELRKFAEEIADNSSLVRYSVYIQAIGPGSVVVELRFPLNAVGWVLAAMTPDFLHTHNLIEVYVDGKPLTTIEGDQYRLVGITYLVVLYTI